MFLKKLSVVLAFFVLACSLFIGLDRFAHHKSSRFSPGHITTSYSSPEWEIPSDLVDDPKLIDHILSQKFTYFNKGSQAYVYISEDKKYILKFLKQNKLHPNTWLAYLPFSFNPHYQQSFILKKKLLSTFRAIKTAFSDFKHETGLLYVHLNRTDNLNKKVTIFDRKGNVHVVDLDQTSFLIQKKANLIYVRITELMSQGETEQAKQIITSVFSLIDQLGKRGVVDNDPILRKNFGLIDDKAVQIDIGRMRIDPLRIQTMQYKYEVASITKSFKTWIEKNYPELEEHFESNLKEVSSF
ncbi:MAG: hypothetical protein JSR39_06540 [Verrucomicrobia bacterium]|nr:hypothetical protein [Verrucomicrobiota bacterium]